MNNPWIHLIWAAFVLAWLLQGRRRSRKDLAEVLEPHLLSHGLKLVRSQIPPRNVTGPFPQGVVDFGNGGAWLPASYCWQYRRVLLLDPSGEQHAVWARILFTDGRSEEVDWEPSLTTITETAEQQNAELSPAAVAPDEA